MLQLFDFIGYFLFVLVDLYLLQILKILRLFLEHFIDLLLDQIIILCNIVCQTQLLYIYKVLVLFQKPIVQLDIIVFKFLTDLVAKTSVHFLHYVHSTVLDIPDLINCTFIDQSIVHFLLVFQDLVNIVFLDILPIVFETIEQLLILLGQYFYIHHQPIFSELLFIQFVYFGFILVAMVQIAP